MGGPQPRQYMHLARMFRDAASGLPDIVNAEQNWPKYALLLHACELTLKAFCAQSVANGEADARASNHNLQEWDDIALQYGLPVNQHMADCIDELTEFHASHYTRYPDARKRPAPDLSSATSDLAEWLIATVSRVT